MVYVVARQQLLRPETLGGVGVRGLTGQLGVGVLIGGSVWMYLHLPVFWKVF